MALPVYSGPFGEAQAERLLWRAGFGPRQGEVADFAAKGLLSAVRSLTNPPPARLVGPAPRPDGRALEPAHRFGHETLWWLDRMARSNQPLVERMTLIWHDWFATRGVGPRRQQWVLRQNGVLRRHALGSFRALAIDVTRDPAMLMFLSGVHNQRGRPNENYARELMELFTLGAGRGYTERDVREQARALTGFSATKRAGMGPASFRYDRRRHDPGLKRVFGKRGRFDYRRAVDLCLGHPGHPSFFVDKLWSCFVPTPPGDATRRELIALYRAHALGIKPVVEAILLHPDFYESHRMVKPPAVYAAGLLRAVGDGITQDRWSRIAYGADAGQRLFAPPSVAGWNDARWLDTATFHGRFEIADLIATPHAVRRDHLDPYDMSESSEAAVSKALRFWGDPPITDTTRDTLLEFADTVADDQRRGYFIPESYYTGRQNALRVLIATAPELQTA